MFIKTVLEAAFSFPNILQVTKAALNHVDNIEHVETITRNVRFDFVGFTRRVAKIGTLRSDDGGCLRRRP